MLESNATGRQFCEMAAEAFIFDGLVSTTHGISGSTGVTTALINLFFGATEDVLMWFGKENDFCQPADKLHLRSALSVWNN